MSDAETAPETTPQTKREEALNQLYELRDDLAIVAESDCDYATYAETALDELREAEYDV